jgi:hypothetical protein
MDFRGALAAFVGHERIFETAMIETNRLSCLRKQIDDRRTTERERVLVDKQVLFGTAIE